MICSIIFPGSLLDKTCTSDIGGPNEHQQCKFPFVWKGQKHRHCSHSETPSARNEKCKKLFEKYPDIFESTLSNIKGEQQDDDATTSGVILKNEKGDIITTCYSPHPARFGW